MSERSSGFTFFLFKAFARLILGYIRNLAVSIFVPLNHATANALMYGSYNFRERTRISFGLKWFIIRRRHPLLVFRDNGLPGAGI